MNESDLKFIRIMILILLLAIAGHWIKGKYWPVYTIEYETGEIVGNDKEK